MEIVDTAPQRALGDYTSRIQGRQRRQINVRRPDTGDGDHAATSGNSSQRTEGSGASTEPKFMPLIYVPEKQRQESGASAGTQYSGRTQGGGTDSYHGHHTGRARPDSAESVLSTSRGLFKMRPRRNIHVKSIDESDEDRPAVSTISEASEKSDPTGFIRYPGTASSSLARRDRHTVSDLLVARKNAASNSSVPSSYTALPPTNTYTDLHLLPDPYSELHVLQPVADLYAKYQNNGYHPLEARHPPVGSESDMVFMDDVPQPPGAMIAASRPLMFTDNMPFFLDDQLPESDNLDHGVRDADFCPEVAMQEGSNVVVDDKVVLDGNIQDQQALEPSPVSQHPGGITPTDVQKSLLPPAETRPTMESYEERIAALKAKMRESSLTTNSNPQAETLDEKKQRILGTLYKQKYGDTGVSPSLSTYETLDQKKEKILANLRRKHSANLQAQDLLGLVDSRTQSPVPFSRSLSLGATLENNLPIGASEDQLPATELLPGRGDRLPLPEWPPVRDMTSSNLVPKATSAVTSIKSESISQLSGHKNPEPDALLLERQALESTSREISPLSEHGTSAFVKLRSVQSRDKRESANAQPGSFQIRAGTGARSFLDRSEVAESTSRESRSQGDSPNDDMMSVDSGFHDKISSEHKPEPLPAKITPEFDSSKRRGSTSSSTSGSSKAESSIPKSPGPLRRNYLKPWAVGGSTEANKTNANTTPKKKTGPPTKPKPQAPSQPQPRSKSTPPSKSKSTTNLAEVGLTTRRERSSSVVKESDYPETSTFSRSSRLRSSTKAWEQRQAEKQGETKRPTKTNPPPKVPPKPSTPKKTQAGIVGKVNLSEDAAQENKNTHTPRNVSSYDKPWRTGSALAKPGASSPAPQQRSVTPVGSVSLSRTHSPTSGRPQRATSASSSRSHSPSASRSRRGSQDLLNEVHRPPKNPVKGQGSVETKGRPRSPKINKQRPGIKKQGPEMTNQLEEINNQTFVINPDDNSSSSIDSSIRKHLTDEEHRSLLDLAADWLFGEEEAAIEVLEILDGLEMEEGQERMVKEWVTTGLSESKGSVGARPHSDQSGRPERRRPREGNPEDTICLSNTESTGATGYVQYTAEQRHFKHDPNNEMGKEKACRESPRTENPTDVLYDLAMDAAHSDGYMASSQQACNVISTHQTQSDGRRGCAGSTANPGVVICKYYACVNASPYWPIGNMIEMFA